MQVLPVCVSGVWSETYSSRLRAAFCKTGGCPSVRGVHGGRHSWASPSCQEVNRSQLIIPRREPRGFVLTEAGVAECHHPRALRPVQSGTTAGDHHEPSLCGVTVSIWWNRTDGRLQWVQSTSAALWVPECQPRQLAMVRHEGRKTESGSQAWSEQLWVVGAKEERVWGGEEQVPGVTW